MTRAAVSLGFNTVEVRVGDQVFHVQNRGSRPRASSSRYQWSITPTQAWFYIAAHRIRFRGLAASLPDFTPEGSCDQEWLRRKASRHLKSLKTFVPVRSPKSKLPQPSRPRNKRAKNSERCKRFQVQLINPSPRGIKAGAVSARYLNSAPRGQAAGSGSVSRRSHNVAKDGKRRSTRRNLPTDQGDASGLMILPLPPLGKGDSVRWWDPAPRPIRRRTKFGFSMRSRGEDTTRRGPDKVIIKVNGEPARKSRGAYGSSIARTSGGMADGRSRHRAWQPRYSLTSLGCAWRAMQVQSKA